MMFSLWSVLLGSVLWAQGLGDVGQDGVPELLRAGPDLPEITEESDFDPFAPLQIVGGVVTEIQFEGLAHIDEFVVRSSLALKGGDEVDPIKVRESIQGIYETGYFEDVRAEGFRQVSDAESNGVRLLFTIKEKPVIRSVTIQGNKKLDDDALMEEMTIDASDIINYTKIQKNILKMRDAYIEKGYYLVEIEPEVNEISDDAVELVFKIVENRKVLVSTIDFTGNESIRSSKLRRFIQTRQAGVLPFMGGGSFNEATLEADAQILRSVFMEEGFVDAKISPPHSYLSLDKKTISISFDIDEGPQYKIGKVNVRGDLVPEEGLTKAALRQLIDGEMAKDITERWQKVLKDGEESEDSENPEGWEKSKFGVLDFRASHPPLVTGDTFKLSSLQLTMQEVTNLYGDQGYAFVNVIPVTDTDPESGVVDITFDIQKGSKVRIGRIDITGNDPTFDKVVRREIPINEGDLYSGSGIDESRKRLQRLGFFETVDITTPRSKEEPNELRMNIEVAEQPTGSFSFFLGFSNLENFVFTANISKNNFLGLGYLMSLSANISSARQQGNLQLFDPYFLDSRWTLRVNGYSLSQQFIEDEYQRGGSIAVGRYLDRRDDWRLEFDYTFEDTGLNSIDAYKARVLGGQLYRNGLTSTNETIGLMRLREFTLWRVPIYLVDFAPTKMRYFRCSVASLILLKPDLTSVHINHWLNPNV